MNWLKRIGKLIGRFWSNLFADQSFIDFVKESQALAGKDRERGLLEQRSGMVVADKVEFQPGLPFTLYIRKEHYSETGVLVKDIRCCAPPLDLVVEESSSISFSDDYSDSTYGWDADVLYSIPVPCFISNHVVNHTVTLSNGVDYIFINGHFLLCANPSVLEDNFDTVALTENGLSTVYYKAYGFTAPHLARKDAVAAFEFPELSREYAPVAWDMHCNGVNRYNLGLALGMLSGSVVAENDGNITGIWVEQGRICATVDDKAYFAPAPGVPLNKKYGESVKAGDTLFGGLCFDDDSDSSIPCIKVMTDAGELSALNQLMDAYHVPDESDSFSDSESFTVLPLLGPEDTVRAYRKRCYELNKDSRCPVAVVPSRVNPYRFIQRLREGYSMVVSVPAMDPRYAVSVVSCIRNNANASGMLTLCVGVEGATVNVNNIRVAEATAGNLSTSVDVGVSVSAT